ncbi:hypothetical protein STRTUCAR8_09840 [Streptomyces turgidiscabies Car8]|uniref:Uncharacterized protein n=1 Tax=Streptomyces turgidiscabies (strain Car8) TaxID=698760 RepID=L7EX65_STRT8|nr:hypothetical protein STRTUCAR8_09840 [Streptomyces turgidiscabies Car8]
MKGARRGPLVLPSGPGWTGRSDPGMPWPTSLKDALDTLEALYSGDAYTTGR